MNQVSQQLSGCYAEDSLQAAKAEAGRQARRLPQPRGPEVSGGCSQGRGCGV